MTGVATKRFACAVAILWALAPASSLRAQIGVGTWVQQVETGRGLTMTVEACCNGGRRLIYSVTGTGDVLLKLESPMDGTEVPVLLGSGRPSGETMAIKRLDDHHTFTVIKMDGKPFGTSKAALSADGKTLTVENATTVAARGQTAAKKTETWVRK